MFLGVHLRYQGFDHEKDQSPAAAFLPFFPTAALSSLAQVDRDRIVPNFGKKAQSKGVAKSLQREQLSSGTMKLIPSIF